MDPLFPSLPEELSALSDEELQSLLAEHLSAKDLIRENDADFIGERSGEEVVEELRAGVEQIKTLRAEQKERADAADNYKNEIDSLASEVEENEDDESEGDGDGDAEAEESEEGAEEAAVVAEVASEEAEEETSEVEEETVEEPETAVVASAEKPEKTEPTQIERRRAARMIRPPAPAKDRQAPADQPGTQLVAAAGAPGLRAGTVLDRLGLANAMIDAVKRLGRPSKYANGVEDRILLASADFPFPENRVLYANDPDGNTKKLRAIGNPFLGAEGQEALVASGGLCAPLTPFYDIPDFAVTDRPVRDSLPSFRAERGGVSVPSVSTIGAIESAITVIEAEDDALGGTFATKSCQDMDCATWTDVAVGIISHCREYGNLNSMAWPEGIAHENNLTMAAHARTAETRLLDRIKALSINVTTADVYSSTWDLIYAITRAAAGIRYRLRLGLGQPALRALLPAWVPGMLVADQAGMAVSDRYKSLGQVTDILRGAGVTPAFYLDPVTGGTSQGFADETASALDDFPDVIQWALYVEGEFLHIDGGTLELGVVRDSTLNSTNDYQVFGETFENVARIGPEQGALWVSSTVCPSGEFPALTTALSC